MWPMALFFTAISHYMACKPDQNVSESWIIDHTEDVITQVQQFDQNFCWIEKTIGGLIVLTGILIVGWLMSRTEIHWHHAGSTVEFQTRGGDCIEFSQLCKSVTPRLFLNPFMRNSHVQTLLSMFDKHSFPIYFRRMIFQSANEEYQGSFAIDLTAPAFTTADPSLPPRTAYYDNETQLKIRSDDSTPMLVILHGLCGGSHEQYLQHVLAPLMKGEQKWQACVVLSRGCGKSSITSGGMYYAHATSDVKQVVEWLQRSFPNRPLYGVGFSMGANIMTRYIADQGEECALKAAVVISNPWNLETTALHLQRSFFGRWFYSPAMTANLMQVFKRNAAKIKTKAGEPLGSEPASRVRLMHEYDRHIQCPTWGYPTERVYYREASSSDAVLKVRIPFWAINSEDDPIVGPDSLPKGEFSATPYTVMCTTNRGGHLGWVQPNGRRWYARGVVSFFQRTHAMNDATSVKS